MSAEDEDRELLMPFVVCHDQGGPYEPNAFVAGVYYGEVDAALTRGEPYTRYVPSPLVPQLDLLAMHHGYQIEATPWEGHEDEWTLVALAALPSKQEGRQ